MTKKICFTGSQGTGKTSMRNELCKYFNERSVTNYANYRGVVESISRDAKQSGFNINKETDFESQYYMASKYISADLLTKRTAELHDIKYIILDRAVIDVLPYTVLAKNIDSNEYRFIAKMLEDHFKVFRPDILFYCKPLKSLVDDGDINRSTDVKFQEDIDKLFFAFIKTFINDGINVVVLENDTLENRMKIVFNEIGKL